MKKLRPAICLTAENQDDDMRSTETLKENNDFRRLYKRGKSYVSPQIVVYAAKNRQGTNRIGITVSKKLGKAVQRNRAKRIIREAYRANEEKLGIGYDLVFVARARCLSMKSTALSVSMGRLLKSAGLIRESLAK